MDIYDYLKMDHEKVDHLFKLFKDSKILKRKKEIAALISQELLVHAHAEQETFYRKLAEYPVTQELALHGKKEHVEIEEQIKRVNSSLTGKNWEEAVFKLKDLVDHHVREEENEIFKQAKKVLSDKDAKVIKERMHYLKGKFLLWLEKPVSPQKVSKTKISKQTKKPSKKSSSTRATQPYH